MGRPFTTIYLWLLGLLACYGFYRYTLLALYYRVKRRRPPEPVSPRIWPTVTMQIPIYNERYVVERAIRSACEVDYPAERLEIQLLDDSTDDTPELIAQTIAPYQERGLKIIHLRRQDRCNFKAGALAEGLRHASGELLAIFDADFVIPREFLKRAVPFFADPRVGMVQARWGHVNARYSLLTLAQAIFLEGHFRIEQVARHRGGRFFNFNGTAGIWRKTAIITSGGWQPDTLTEDLDLSYRAQLGGWRCLFLPDLVVPGELPVEMNAFKTQQYRWTKGSIQTAKKLLGEIFSSRLPLAVKGEAFFHLTAFCSYPIGLLATLCLPLFLTGMWQLPHYRWYVDAAWFFLLVIPGVCFYFCAQRELYPEWYKRLALVPWAMTVGMGLSVNNARAVLDGLFGRHSTFVRTPKFGIQSKADRWDRACYHAPGSPTSWLELALALYFAVACVEAVKRHQFMTLPFAVMLCLGFGYVGWLSLWQQGVLLKTVLPRRVGAYASKLRVPGTLRAS